MLATKTQHQKLYNEPGKILSGLLCFFFFLPEDRPRGAN